MTDFLTLSLKDCDGLFLDVSGKRARQQEKKVKLEALLKKESETNSRFTINTNLILILVHIL